MDQQTLQSFQSQLNNVTNVLIATRPNPTFDAIAAMTSFALSFEKMQKKVTLFCASPMTVEFSNLVGMNKIGTQVGNKNLVVTLKGFAKMGVDKVSYNVEGDDFNLVVVPKAGSPSFDQNSIGFSHSGADAQLVILVDVQNLEQLGEFYQKEKDMFANVPVANVDCQSANVNYGKFNLTNAAASSQSEIVGYLLQYLKYQIDSDVATNIFYGLMQSTDNLSGPKVRAETYELIGMMMRLGARRIQVMQFLGAQMLQGQTTAEQYDSGTVPQYVAPTVPQYNSNTVSVAAPQMPQAQPVQTVQPPVQTTPIAPATQPIQPVIPMAENTNLAQSVSPSSASNDLNPPADWTQPKIFKGGNLG